MPLLFPNTEFCDRNGRAQPIAYSDSMTISTQIDQVCERVERLLLRHEEAQRTQALLVEQVQQLTQERDSLKSRLAAARARVDDLLDRLPTPQEGADAQTNTGEGV